MRTDSPLWMSLHSKCNLPLTVHGVFVSTEPSDINYQATHPAGLHKLSLSKSLMNSADQRVCTSVFNPLYRIRFECVSPLRLCTPPSAVEEQNANSTAVSSTTRAELLCTLSDLESASLLWRASLSGSHVTTPWAALKNAQVSETAPGIPHRTLKQRATLYTS